MGRPVKSGEDIGGLYCLHGWRIRRKSAWEKKGRRKKWGSSERRGEEEEGVGKEGYKEEERLKEIRRRGRSWIGNKEQRQNGPLGYWKCSQVLMHLFDHIITFS